MVMQPQVHGVKLLQPQAHGLPSCYAMPRAVECGLYVERPPASTFGSHPSRVTHPRNGSKLPAECHAVPHCNVKRVPSDYAMDYMKDGSISAKPQHDLRRVPSVYALEGMKDSLTSAKPQLSDEEDEKARIAASTARIQAILNKWRAEWAEYHDEEPLTQIELPIKRRRTPDADQ